MSTVTHPTPTTSVVPVRFGGVDTHADVHHAAVVDSTGRHLADQRFSTTGSGYRALLAWLVDHHADTVVGVEGTGSYGAELTRVLTAAGTIVIEINRPDRSTRHRLGKTDAIDAYQAATTTAALTDTPTGEVAASLVADTSVVEHHGSVPKTHNGAVPKTRHGAVEDLRSAQLTRRSAVKARTQTINQLRALIVTAPDSVRARLRDLTEATLITTLVRSRPGSQLGRDLATLARRWRYLNEEIAGHDVDIARLTTEAGASILELYGAGPDSTARLLIAAGDNPERLRSEASFAALCGVSPIPASSGKTNRHRLNRGGDRSANNALYTIAWARFIAGARQPATHAYVTRKRGEGADDTHILRCLKRAIAREIYHLLVPDHRTGETSPTSP